MRYHGLDIIAPAAPVCAESGFGEAEVFGAAAWLWMHSAAHRDVPLLLLSTLLLPALKTGQFVLASESGKPVFYLGWAWLSADAETRYLSQPPQSMRIEDWTSGDRLWLLDWIAPFGHTRTMRTLIGRRLFPGWCARALSPWRRERAAHHELPRPRRDATRGASLVRAAYVRVFHDSAIPRGNPP